MVWEPPRVPTTGDPVKYGKDGWEWDRWLGKYMRTTKNFRSTKLCILQELQSNFERKAIRNLSSYQLSPNKSEVFVLGINFVPTPLTSARHLIQRSASRLTKTVKKQLHFKPFLNYQTSQILQTFHLGAPWTKLHQPIILPGTDLRSSP